MLGPLRILAAALLALVHIAPAAAQVADDFSDGDFSTNPSWEGDTERFIVVPFGTDFALRSNGLAEPDTIALATASGVTAGQWNFTFRWEANLTNANGTRVYLVADSPELKGDVEGYYVQLGTNNSDEVRLYRQDGAPDDRIELGASTEPLLAGDTGTVDVEVLRDENGAWQVLVDGASVIDGVEDGTYTSSAALGIWLKHSSANGAAFFWDDVLADPTVADLTPPVPQSVAVLDNGGTLLVAFNENLDLETVTPSAFSVDSGIGAPASASIDGVSTVRLTFDPSIPTGAYILTVDGVADGAGNATENATIDFDVAADQTPPNLVSAEATSPTRVDVAFDEPVEGCDLALYTITPDIGQPDDIDCSDAGIIYGLLLDVPLSGPQTYTVTAANVADLAGNVQPETSANFFFGDFDVPAPREIVINEVMYNPPDAASNEYVELFNRTPDRTFDLSTLTLSDDASTPAILTDTPTALGPGGFAVLVRDPDAFAAQFPGVSFIAVNGFPALNNGGDTPTLRLADAVIDAVPYEPSWGGTDASLERRDPDGPSDAASNFSTSTDPSGGTPGAVNSVFEVDTAPPVPIDATVTNEGQTVTVIFDEPLDAATVLPEGFSIDGGAPNVETATYEEASFAAVLGLAAPLQPGSYTVTISGVADTRDNATAGATIGITFDPDLTPPMLASVVALDASTVAVVFTEPVDPATAGTAANYAIDGGIGTPADASVAPDGNPARVVLALGSPLSGPQTYTLTASNIADLAGNVLSSDTAPFFFGEGDEPEPLDIVVSEIMYDPPDAASNEYVELFNRTPDRTFDLSAFTLGDLSASTPAADEPVFLGPGAYVVLVRDPDAFAARFPGVGFVAVDDFPALNNSGDAVILRFGEANLPIDSVRYEPDWGGTDASLERRSADGPSNVASNWATSVDPLGGTPAAPNSVPPDTAPPVLVDVDLDPDGLGLTVFFDEPLDPETVEPSAFSIDGGAPPVVETDVIDDGSAVRLTLGAPLAAGDYILTINGVADLLGNVTMMATIGFTFSPDETPPVLLRASALDASTVDVLFSEPVTENSAGDPSRYSIDGGIGTPLAVEYAPDGNLARVLLSLAVPLTAGTSYTLTVTGIADVFGNVLDAGSAPFFFGEGAEPAARDVVVNEIQFQSPSGNDGEYVELYNRSSLPFDLSQFSLADAGSTPAPLSAAPLFLHPDQYAVLVADAAVFGESFPEAGPVIEVDGFPNLNSGGDAVVLRYPSSGLTVDSVQYVPGWGTSDTAALERLDPAGPSSSFVNWASSTAPAGGTPGGLNSVFAPDVGAPTVLFAEQIAADTVRVYFSEPLDPASVDLSDFSLGGGAAPTAFTVSASAPTVDLAFDAVDGSTLEVGSVADFVGNESADRTLDLARLAPVGGLVVNEIMFDPLRDANDGRLDGTEYIELFNATNLTLTLTRAQITDAPDENGAVRAIDIGGQSTGAVPFAALPPGGYAVAFADTSVFGDRFASPPSQSALADSSLLARFYSAADFSETLLLPVDRTTLSLTNTEDTIRLLRCDATLIDSVAYSADWHRPELDDATGIALERLSPEGPSSDASNWTSSLDPSGGTPGRPNSVFLLPGEEPPAPGLAISPSPFDASVGTQISYTLEAEAALVRVRIFDAAGRLVRTLEDAALGGATRTGTLTWQGRGDDGRALRVGIYVVFLEALDLRGGQTEAYKEVVVLGRNL